jgi:hypothetical protein
LVASMVMASSFTWHAMAAPKDPGRHL